MNKERRLGRGLEALLGPAGAMPQDAGGYRIPFGADGGNSPDWNGDNTASGLDASHDCATGAASATTPSDGLVYLGIDQIAPNRYQPRQDFDDAQLEELAESIRQHGVIQPIVVRRGEDGRFELISGERRLRAAARSGWTSVPAWIRDADERQMAEIAIVENVQRQDLNPLERAVSFQRYLEQYGGTKEELAVRISIDRSTIANLIRLLELPHDVQQALRAGSITQGHARALLPLGDEREQVAFCRRIIDQQLSVRAVEREVTDAIRQADAAPDEIAIAGSIASGGDPDGAVTVAETLVSRRKPGSKRRTGTRAAHTATLESELRSTLGTKVEIRETSRGRGRVIVHFSSHAEFERLFQTLTSLASPQSHVG